MITIIQRTLRNPHKKTYSPWRIDSLPNYQSSTQSTFHKLKILASLVSMQSTSTHCIQIIPDTVFPYLEYFSYSESFIKIEISVIVSPKYTLVNNDNRWVHLITYSLEIILPIFSAGKQSKRKLLASKKNLTRILEVDILILGIIHDCPLRMVPYIKGITIRS